MKSELLEFKVPFIPYLCISYVILKKIFLPIRTSKYSILIGDNKCTLYIYNCIIIIIINGVQSRDSLKIGENPQTLVGGRGKWRIGI